MTNLPQTVWLRLIRFSIVPQVLCTVTWLVAPDMLPDMLAQAMLFYDKPIYETLDRVSSMLIYSQTIFCALLWYPRRPVAWLYVGTVVLLPIISALSGPVAVAAFDGTISTLAGLASGASLVLLYQGHLLGFFESREQVTAIPG